MNTPQQTSRQTSGQSYTHPHLGDQMLTLKEVAELLRVPENTLRYWRHLGSGPHSFTVGRSVRYWRGEVWAWLERQAQRSRPENPADHRASERGHHPRPDGRQ